MKIRHWQNLIHRHCPDCDITMDKKRVGFSCPQCSFFITKTKFTEILTDSNHAAVRYLNNDEKKMLKSILNEVGSENSQKDIDKDDFWNQPEKW